MIQNRFCQLLVYVILLVGGLCGSIVHAAEPAIADYTSYPLFMSSEVAPNILVIMDNSGSMNYPAYGEFQGTGSIVTGDDYACGTSQTISIPVSRIEDDAEEYTSSGSNTYYSNSDLDLGNYNLSNPTDPLVYDTGSSPSRVGLRFSVNIPKNATITNAYIEFEANATSSYTSGLYTYGTPPGETDFVIVAENTDDAQIYDTSANNIADRSYYSTSVAWDDEEHWTAGTKYQTPNLAALIQTIVNRAGWTAGSSIAFKITGTGKRDARAYDYGDHTHGPVLVVTFDGCQEYYGYFDPTSRYTYASSIFSRDSNGAWSGNFLNWLTMRRVDVGRKVLMGGLANPRTTSGTQKLTGENSPSVRSFRKAYNGTGTSGITPFTGNYTYYMDGGNFTVYNGPASQGTYSIVVEKVAAEEPNDFADLDGSGPTTVGILQRYGDAARWGNMWFNNNGADTINNGNGGVVSNPIADGISENFINDFQNTAADTWTPLAETYYTAVKYFKQEAIDGSLNYSNNPGTTLADPFDGSAYCAKNFVLLITDGASTMDAVLPNDVKDYADASKYGNAATNDFLNTTPNTTTCSESSWTGCEYGSAGTDYLKDVALWARSHDIRTDIQDDQNIVLYAVYAFGQEDNARELLKQSAKNGGFIDRDGDGLPSGLVTDTPGNRLEWDENGDGLPDTYFEASDGAKLQKALGAAIRDILERSASGTAASVLATNSEGEGNLVQAYFRPSYSTTIDNNSNPVKVTWSGYLQSLWVDACGNLREDANANQTLDTGEGGTAIDPIVEYVFDDTTSTTKIRRYLAHPNYDDPYYCDYSGTVDDYCTSNGITSCYEDVPMDAISPLFEAGRLLALADPEARKIFTYIDDDVDGVVDETTYDAFDSSGEVISFSETNASVLTPYLGVINGSSSDGFAYLGSDHASRVDNLINYIRGVDFFDSYNNPTLRNRTTNEIDGSDHVWKLGDIVHSTPISVSKPTDNYHIIYSDRSYQTYYDAVKSRETVVYTGANDGMLHAFTSGTYDSANGKYTDPADMTVSVGSLTLTVDMSLGSELWAYIPQTLLPHLKFLADPDYTHVYYVDMKPKVFEAKILPDNTHYTDSDTDLNWGTFIIVGLNLGGKRIWTNEFDTNGDGTVDSSDSPRYFDPTYIFMDITEPRNPVLMWERSYSGLNLSQSSPAIVKVGEEWFAVFGSGPTTYDGTSTETGKIFVVDLKTGDPRSTGSDDWLFELSEDYAFVSSPTALDKSLNYNVDAIYFGETYCQSADCASPKQYEGKIYKIPVTCNPCDWNVTLSNPDPVYEDDPSQWPSPSAFYEGTAPFTAPTALSVDSDDNCWVYVGTGRYLREADKTTQNQEYIIGIKDPFYNENYDGSYYRNFSSSKTLASSDLFDASDIAVTTAGYAFIESTGSPYGGNLATAGFSNVVDDANDKDGWIRALEVSTSPSERVVSKSSVLGGIVLTPSFTPNDDVCGFGGVTEFYGLYYETGTGYTKHVFEWDGSTITYGSKTYEKVNVKLSSTSIGAPPPAVGIHVGRQGGTTGAKAFLQLSTGEIADIDIDTALPLKSALTNWILNP
ncbi:PilC/PilY family type IV pilus protein [uncultured Desulfosarcina sp.]|uniref:pilus assembly protein n=1 Tax=uncultured Desulfosarcina sp. TaxID=218289 RepID=UPI0029C99093|nr:PilC/PilY family type IV pilus protein [uncultured Desulfosarcina sp.]